MNYIYPAYAANNSAHEHISMSSRARSIHESPTRNGAHIPRLVDRESALVHARILIVDDSTLHRESLAAVVAANCASAPAVAWDLPSLQASLGESGVDIVLVSMATRQIQTLMALIREHRPHTKVIVTGISEDDEQGIIGCAEAGVAGYHLRTESLAELLRLITKVLDGESCCSPKVSAVLLKRLSMLAARREPETKELVLTSREIQILRMLELGMSNRDIADRLCIALHTVKNHVHSVLSKLGVSTRTAAAAYSRSLRLDGVGIGI
jgi:DNA-binding NarL/FixJ family response regulator